MDAKLMPTPLNVKVSIITVCYNILEAGRRDHFKQMLESVQNQTYKNIEHVIVDGASTDGSVKYIKELIRGRNNIIFISKKDTGIYDAMNRGARHSSGKYITYLNSDDFYHDITGIDNVVYFLEKKNADYSYGTVKILLENGKEKLFRPKMHRFLTHLPFSHQSFFLRRDIFFKENGFDQDRFQGAADYDLILRVLLKRYKGVFVPKIFVSFRRGGFSSAGDAQKKEVVDVYKKNYAICFPNYIEKDWLDLMENNGRSFPVLFLIKNCTFSFVFGYLLRNAIKALFEFNLGKNKKVKVFSLVLYEKKKQNKKRLDSLQ